MWVSDLWQFQYNLFQNYHEKASTLVDNLGENQTMRLCFHAGILNYSDFNITNSETTLKLIPEYLDVKQAV